ncbi:MAG: sugar transferase [Fusobacteriaceae bacterium]
MFYEKYVKRFFDILVGIILFVPLILIILFVGIIIKLDSKGEVIFKHKRFGKHLKTILVYKFRTMVKDAENIGPKYTLDSDDRVTKVGKILRKISVDELPQIINVLKGEMSFIGPRPDAYTQNPNKIEKQRTAVLPGITGYAQINGRSSLTPEEKEKFDLYYIKKISFMLDLKILIKTIKSVLDRKNTN